MGFCFQSSTAALIFLQTVIYLHKGASLSTTYMVPQQLNVTGMRVGMKINLQGI